MCEGLAKCVGPAKTDGDFETQKSNVQHQSPKHIKNTRLHQQVLSDNVYRLVNMSLFVLFLLIKNPLNAI